MKRMNYAGTAASVLRRTRLILARLLLAVGTMLGAAPAHASVTLLLEEPYGGMGSFNPTGHAAIYLDHLCAATPVMLRPCRTGELGVVISRYDGISNHDWVAIPLIPYLYAVETPDQIPVTVNRADVGRLRDAYRRAHLQLVAPDGPNGAEPSGNWYELIGSTFDRSLYGFQVNSTPAQDAMLMHLLNDRKNAQLYNGMFRNCADFARVTLNRFYPHMVRRNLIADLAMTTPKGVARSVAHYAAKHPEIDLQTFAVQQLSGDLPRSQAAQGVTEGLIKEYGLPLALLSPVTTGAVLAAYVGHGRFAEPKGAPTLNLRPGIAMNDAITLHTTPESVSGGEVAVQQDALRNAATSIADAAERPNIPVSSSLATATSPCARCMAPCLRPILAAR